AAVGSCCVVGLTVAPHGESGASALICQWLSHLWGLTKVSRQEQSEKTRSAIIDAAAAAFDAHGYQGAGLSLILDQAGVTRGALYFHFASKEELAQELIRTQFENIERHLSDGAKGLQALINLTFAMASDLISDIRVRAGVRLVIEHASFPAPTTDAYL